MITNEIKEKREANGPVFILLLRTLIVQCMACAHMLVLKGILQLTTKQLLKLKILSQKSLKNTNYPVMNTEII